jgi:SAM-dependent methyltransferase
MTAAAEVVDLAPLADAPPAFWTSLREALRAAGYSDGVLDLAEDILPGMPEAARTPIVQSGLLRLRRPDATLAALFVYGAAVDRPELEAALGPPMVSALLEVGVLQPQAEAEAEAEPGRLRAGLRIVPFDGLWIASDPLFAAGDPVMGPTMTTDVLRRAMPDPAGRTLLDVGCGAGTLAIWAAARGARAVAVDLAPRAIALARLNLLLNQVDCELGTGDLTAPVAGRAFDLVVSQPPFLIKPPDVAAVTFLHGGSTGVEIVLRLLGELDGVLAPGGRALVLFDAPTGGPPIARRVLEAVRAREPVGVVTAVAGHHSADMVAFLTAAISHRWLDAAYAATAARYRAHLEANAIERVAHVLLDLRRLPAGAGAEGFAATFGWRSLRGVTRDLLDQTWRSAELLGRGPEALLQAPLRLRDGVRLRIDQPLDGGAVKLTLTSGDAVASDQTLNENAAAILRALASAGTVAAACEDLAEPGQAGELYAPVLDLVRGLILQGLVVPD